MKFVELIECIQKLDNIVLSMPVCVDPNKEGYTLLRVQPKGNVSYSRRSGVWLEASEHREACISLLRQAQERNADLVLFPEYCIGYDVLQQIQADQNLWPEDRKLWVLPCQGVPIKEFDSFLQNCKSNPDICLIDDAWHAPELDRRQFVTALFYCFLVWKADEGEQKLCLVPQLKTHPMGDGYCSCELAGMSTGSIIYTINHRLVTLLCADSLNHTIQWADLWSSASGGLILLHPQLNQAPRDRVFSRLLQELEDHSQPGLYISCNWAAGTCASPANGEEGHSIHITLSWAAVYRKHTEDISGKWIQDRDLHTKNAAYGLFGGIMSREQMEAWYSESSEHAMLINLPNLTPSSFAEVRLNRILADTCYALDEEGRNWVETVYADTALERRVKDIDEKNPYRTAMLGYCSALGTPYRYPVEHPGKLEIDCFWALTLAANVRESMEMESLTQPRAWTLFLDEKDVERGKKAMVKLLHLRNILEHPEAFPPRFAALAQNHTFCYHPAAEGRPPANLCAGEREMIVSYAEDSSEADLYAARLMRIECNNNQDLAERTIGVFYQDASSNQICMAPHFSKDILQGDHLTIKGDITNG